MNRMPVHLLEKVQALIYKRSKAAPFQHALVEQGELVKVPGNFRSGVFILLI